MKVVLDTNVMVSAFIVKKGISAQILKRTNSLQLFTSEEILAECHRVLHYPRIQKKYQLTESAIDGYLQRLRSSCAVISGSMKVAVVKEDPNDDMVIACATLAQADFIVSGDPHVTRIKEYQGTVILTPAQFLKLLV